MLEQETKTKLFECVGGPLDGRIVYAGEGISTLKTKVFFDKETNSIYKWNWRVFEKEVYDFFGYKNN